MAKHKGAKAQGSAPLLTPTGEPLTEIQLTEFQERARTWLRQNAQGEWLAEMERGVIVRTVGDLYLAIRDHRPLLSQASAITFTPGANLSTVSFPVGEEEARRKALCDARVLIKLEGGDQLAALTKLICRVALQPLLDESRVFNLPLADFVAALQRGPRPLPPSPPATMSPAMLEVWNAVVPGGVRMGMAQIAAAIAKKNGGIEPSMGMLKQTLAAMSKHMKCLPHRSDTNPRGYGLPDWD